MIRVIWKFPLKLQETNWIEAIPRNARILTVGIQQGMTGRDIMLWAYVDPEEPSVRRRIRIVDTGNRAPNIDSNPYIGTVFIGEYVYHVFDEGEF